MYVGKYLEENIGHEVINLFKSDNGENYIYINEDGRINPKYDNSVRAVILTKHVEKGVMEVVAKAEELTQILFKIGNTKEESVAQIAYIDENRVFYGGVPLYKIHNDTDEEKITLSFLCQKLRLPIRPLYLIENEEKTSLYENYVSLPEKHFSNQSLKMYYPQNSFPQDYNALEKLILDDRYWEPVNTTQMIDLNDQGISVYESNFLGIIKKEYDELVYSNMLAYYFEQNRSVFQDFTKDVLGIDGFTKDYNIVRELNDNIDIWIEDETNVIIIENKIKSKVNGERNDVEGDSQLSKYYRYAIAKEPNKTIHSFVFAPDYNPIKLDKYIDGEKYRLVKYSQIFDFFHKRAGDMIHTRYFREFLDALEIHSKTIDNSNFEIMKDRFISRIRRIRDNT